MLTGILSDICVILVLGVGAGGLLILLLCLLDRLLKDLLLYLKLWPLFVRMALGRCPHCGKPYRAARGKEARP